MSTPEQKDFWVARFERLYEAGGSRWMAMTWRAYLEAYPDCDSASRYNAEKMVEEYSQREINHYGFEMTEEVWNNPELFEDKFRRTESAA